MSGLPSWLHWLAWMLHSLALNMITSTVVCLALFIPFAGGGVLSFRHSDFPLWWFVFLLFIMATTALGFFLANLFSSGEYFKNSIGKPAYFRHW